MHAAAKRDGEPIKILLNEYGLIATEPPKGYKAAEDRVTDFTDVLIPHFIQKSSETLRKSPSACSATRCRPRTPRRTSKRRWQSSKRQGYGTSRSPNACSPPTAIRSSRPRRCESATSCSRPATPLPRARGTRLRRRKRSSPTSAAGSFSDPRISAFILWNLFDREGETDDTKGNISWRPKYKEGIITIGLDGAFHPKPAWYSLQNLIKSEWSTSLDLTTNAEGRVGGSAFYGLYDCTVAEGATTMTKRVHIERGGENRFEIAVP